MILWVLLTLMVAVTVAGLTIPLVRRADARGERGTTLGVLKAQLADLEASADPEAEGLRTEVKRRILAEGREQATPEKPLADKTMVRLALALAAVVALASTGLYLAMGRPDLAEKTQTEATPGDVAAMIGQLEAKMAASPNDPEGWRMLGWSYHQTGRFAEAAEAYGRAAALEPTNSEHRSAQGESLVQAANGAVTPEALAAFNAALGADPADPRARYFLAVAKDQSGDHKGAMDDWIALLNDAPAGAPWVAEVHAFVERTAAERGIDIAGRLKSAPGPTPEQMATAQQMPRADQQAMIRGMVEGLDAKLRANPADLDGWLRLMRARMVLGQPDKATEAYRSARKAFTGDARKLATLEQGAKELKVPGA